ncbi:MAG TPA: peptide chain release factor N(5)-glutamine methyltransferase [Euryarchaeota archaeon]|nr:peptide chain release factor N(5)-glutamine methyltransferase [Euryarchaeota archaeon]
MTDRRKRLEEKLAGEGVAAGKADMEHILDLFEALETVKGEPPEVERLILDLKRAASGNIRPERVLGCALFFGHALECPLETLIPTNDTEEMVRRSIELLSRRSRGSAPLNVLDLGTGCGNIGLSIASSVKDVILHATDIVTEALDVTRRNAERLGVSERVFLHHGDLFEPLEGKGLEGSFDMIICNPPYIPTNSIYRLPDIVKRNQPREALDAGPYGIDIIRRLVKEAPVWLSDGGHLIFEIGKGQGKFVRRLIDRYWAPETVREGFYGNDLRFFECMNVISEEKDH